jgi:dethiobiotin synthetase
VGTDTHVGKTHQACLLARSLVAQGCHLGLYKPVSSGWAETGCSDAERLWDAGKPNAPLERVCPQQFTAPLAPPLAAELEGTQVDELLLLEGALWWNGRCEFLIVEGAGGVLSPISFQITVADFAVQLQLPVAIVAANRLGVVNQTLSAVEVLLARKIEICGVILNELPSEGATSSSLDISRGTNFKLLRRFLQPQIPLVSSVIELGVTWSPR